MAIDRNIGSSGTGAGVSPNEALDDRITAIENNFIAGKYKITGVDAVSYTQEITIAHGLGTDNIVLGVGAIGSVNGLVDSQAIDSNGYTEYESGNGANLGAFAEITAPAAGNIILQARNQSNVEQDITIHYWVRKVTSEEVSVAWSSQTPVIPTTGVFELESATYSVQEGGTSITIPVNRTGGSVGSASVSYTTADSTAIAGNDYITASGTLAFADGETQKSVVVTITQDAIVESGETFTLTLSVPTNGTTLGGISTTTVTITDDDTIAADYYISTTGNDGGTGLVDDPFATIGQALSVMAASEVCYMLGGTYAISSEIAFSTIGGSGTETTLSAAPGQTVILDFGSAANATHRGLKFDGCSHWRITGITIIDVPKQGTYCQTATNIVFTDCEVSGSGRLATAGTGFMMYGACSDIGYQSCYAHHNQDTTGGNSDGFGHSNITGSGGNYYRDCLAYRNSDDGFDIFQSTCTGVEFTRCRAIQNGTLDGSYTDAGDGNGFKLGGSTTGTTTVATIENCVSALNKLHGFTWNTSVIAHILHNCTAYSNNYNGSGFVYDYNFGGGSGSSTLTIKNSISNGTSPNVNLPSSANITNNTWNLSITAPDFSSVAYGDADYLNLNLTSPCIDVGTDVSIAYLGTAPDLGAYEKA